MKIIFDDWSGLARTAIIGVLTYISLVALLRVSGKRTLSKMNAFDLVVTVALGSTLATAVLSKDTTLADGLLALAMLIGLQYVAAWLSTRSPRFRRLIKSEPTLLFHRGEFLARNLQGQRVTRDEVVAAVRSKGLADLQSVHAVVLETDGSFSVLSLPTTEPKTSSLENVCRAERK